MSQGKINKAETLMIVVILALAVIAGTLLYFKNQATEQKAAVVTPTQGVMMEESTESISDDNPFADADNPFDESYENPFEGEYENPFEE